MTEESQLGPTDDGTVMLDIGGDIGALIIMTGPDLLHAEIEISPADDSAEDVFQAEHPHDHPHSHEHPHDHAHDHSHEHAHDHSHDHSGPARTHVAVRERRVADGVRYAAVYPGLREGEYTVWGLDGQPVEVVRITGGEVAQLDWQ